MYHITGYFNIMYENSKPQYVITVSHNSIRVACSLNDVHFHDIYI